MSDTPSKSRVDRMNRRQRKMWVDLLKQGIEPLAMRPDEVDALLRSDLEKTGKIVKAAGDSIRQ